MTEAHGASRRREAHKVGIIYQERSHDAMMLGDTLSLRLREQGYVTWSAPAARESEIDGELVETDLVLVLGGDGTILSVARLCAPLSVPLLGINFGRVGFLTELEPDEVDEKLPLYLHGDYWIDERSMLHARVEFGGQQRDLLALNDIVLVRGAEPRVVRINIWVDGHPYSTTVADGVIVSTATGSTAYNLAAGGPILHPQVRSAVVTPIAPHLAADRSLILEPTATITLEVAPGSGAAVLSADGQINSDMPIGAQVTVTANRHVTRFLRRRPPTHFYRILTAKLKEEL
ncbi:MAG: NAD(+)/NADH kinase [Ktedonobacterales bacterium]